MYKHPLDYPWDFDDLFINTRQHLKGRKTSSPLNGPRQKFLIHVLGGYTNDILENWILIFSAYYGVDTKITKSDWGAAFSIIDPFRGCSQPDMVLCLNDHRDLITSGNRDRSIIDSNLAISQLTKLIDSCVSRGVAVCLTNYFTPQAGPPSPDRAQSLANVSHQLNSFLQQQQNKQKLLHLISLDQFSALTEEPLTASLRNWYQFGHTLSISGSIILAQAVARHIASLKGLGKKALVVDLDNTLWGGVIGDDGITGIELGPETATGRIFSDIQSHILKLKERGVLLAVASKNEEQNAKEAFDHPSSILKWSDFSVHKANWHNKSANMQDIANSLNINLDSLVFIDDNPIERAEVRTALPMITIPDCGQNPEDFLRALLALDPFNQNTSVTEEDLIRNASFQDNHKREKLMLETTNHANFLKKIGTTISVGPPEEHEYARCLQLTNKTNQFNMTGKRLTAGEFKKILVDPSKYIFVARIADLFGNYGLTGIMYLHRKGGQAHIDNWLMSCRVFSKTAEHAMFAAVGNLMQAQGVTTFSAEYINLSKNQKFKHLWVELGFVEKKTKENDNDLSIQFELLNDVQSSISSIKHYCEIKT